MKSASKRGSSKTAIQGVCEEMVIENGFQGKDGQVVPVRPREIVAITISERYIELYETNYR